MKASRQGHKVLRSERGSRDTDASRSPFAFPSSRADLNPTAKRLLEAARRLLETAGFDALTFEAIGREAGVTSSLIRYHFGDKTGMLVALIDWIMVEDLAELRVMEMPASSSQDFVENLLDVSRALITDTRSSSAFFNLLPHLLQDPRTRHRLAELYSTYFKLNADPLTSRAGRCSNADISALAVLNVAVTDGLMIQRLLEQDSTDIDHALFLWGHLIRGLLSDTDAIRSDEETKDSFREVKPSDS